MVIMLYNTQYTSIIFKAKILELVYCSLCMKEILIILVFFQAMNIPCKEIKIVGPLMNKLITIYL
jgi:hypothetical protein